MVYIVLDLEATCWMGRPPKGVNEIIEIGAIKINRYGEVLGQFSSLVKPTVNPKISGFCSRLTGIKQNQLDLADPFRSWITEHGSDYVLGSWGSNDKGFLWSDCRLHDVDTDWLEPFIDLRTQYVHITKSLKKSNLKYIVEREGFEFEGNEHSAYTDAYNTAKVFIKYIDEWVP